MPADETTQPEPPPPENQNSEASFVPESLQEPKVNAPIPAINSDSNEVPPEPTETLPNSESAIPVKDGISANEPLNEAPSPEITVDPSNPNVNIEKHRNDVTITEVMEPTAQMAGNEPIDMAEEIKTKKRGENLKLANQTRQEKKRKKIDAILDLFAKQTNLTNDEVEKLLHVSDATATRYLETLEKEGKIKQVGKTGKGVMYEKI
ncbi:MAG: hypothetical protein COV33_01600 [Candidatus Zambryskibacteria bacterium CG10_big_fil_rev_8_21_14_0_10_34_34]|uniref:HTH iclR-type domain-containing protein n=1 Tax=Candidatus Zambryskibacteria bacterium CG10_big_fil_rev_8_21_14_0_10_34_34 TaxID=1975114 RepID=A0A2H0R0T4_9BACT|nr:MAG: hypothetical protein COV33_01600 [Candidatus Zambryskibacteria bacterium CG10_big_fil_rev_8_21_14_0_10_34_34]